MSLDYILSLQIAVKAHFWFLVSNICLTSLSIICLLLILYIMKHILTFFYKENTLCLFCILWCKRRIVIHQASFGKASFTIAEFLLTSCGKLLKVFIYIKTRHRCNCFLDNSMYRFTIGLILGSFVHYLYIGVYLTSLKLVFDFCLFLFPCDYIIAQFLWYYKWYIVQS